MASSGAPRDSSEAAGAGAGLKEAQRRRGWLWRPWLWAGAGMLLVLSWQAATVHVNYNDHWTGLFRIGARTRMPEPLARDIQRSTHPSGYDGQYYRMIAHDPFLRGKTAGYIDAPLLRARRILVPLLAWTLALGRDEGVDGAYVLVVALCMFWGVYWLGRIALLEGRHPALGLLFLVIPAVVVSADSMTVDVAMATLTVCFAWQYRSGREGGVWVTLAAACLVRESGVFLVCAAVLAAGLEKSYRKAALLATACLPAVCWYAYLHHVLPPTAVTATGLVPGWGIPGLRLGPIGRLIDPPSYPNLTPFYLRLARFFDRAALVGALGAITLGILRLKKTRPVTLKITLAMFLLSLLMMTGKEFWTTPYGYSRPLAPLFALILTGDSVSAECCGIAAVAACVLVDLRVLTELFNGAVHVLRWLTGG